MKNQIVLYHGSVVPDLQKLEPRKRYCPGELIDRFQGKPNVPPAIYATDDPACAAAHSFDWNTSQGFDLSYEGDRIVLVVPEKFKDKLKQKIYIYKIPAKEFEQFMDRNYWSLKAVKVLGVEVFESVERAVVHFGGKVRYK